MKCYVTHKTDRMKMHLKTHHNPENEKHGSDEDEDEDQRVEACR